MSTPLQQVEKLISEGRFLEARNRLEPLLAENTDLRVKQLLALSLAKSGAPKAALDLLEPVYQQHPEDPEISGILGSIYKELFKETRNSRYAVLSRDTYLRNFKVTRHYYTGINAASMYAISGSVSRAKEIARELVPMLSPDSRDPWELASLAEAFLLIREKEKSVELYIRCRHAIGSDWGKVSAIYNQLWLLNHYIPVSSQIMDTFRPPVVAAFVGHMIDHPSRKLQRFPSSIEAEVKQAIRGAIQSVNAKIGYCSMACGGDILFAEAMAETGGEVNLLLPFAEHDFLESSVRYAGDHWVARFENLKKNFPITYITTDTYAGTDELFALQSRVIFGAAVRRALMLHSAPHLITLYSDVDLVSKKGGTYDTLKFWPDNEKRININPQNFITTTSDKQSSVEREAAAGGVPASSQRHVRFLLSVTVAENNGARQGLPPALKEKLEQWRAEERDENGDTIVIAFKSLDESVSAAWELLRMGELPLKISLHVGPVYLNGSSGMRGEAVDVARGVHAFSLAGKVYASFPYASILSLHGNSYAVEYAGVVVSATQSVSVFQLNRHTDAFDF